MGVHARSHEQCLCLQHKPAFTQEPLLYWPVVPLREAGPHSPRRVPSWCGRRGAGADGSRGRVRGVLPRLLTRRVTPPRHLLVRSANVETTAHKPDSSVKQQSPAPLRSSKRESASLKASDTVPQGAILRVARYSHTDSGLRGDVCGSVTAEEVIQVLLSCDEKELFARLTAHPELRTHLLSLVRRIPAVCVSEADALLEKLRDIPSSMVCSTP